MPRWANENRFNPELQTVAIQYGIPLELLKGLVAQESKFDPNAYRQEGKDDASVGLTQVLLSTARALGYRGDPDGLFSPGLNVSLGARVLQQNLRQLGGDVPAALSMYNGGLRPQFAFGVRATKPGRVCLAKDAQGKCLRWYDYKVGEFGNQPYVDAVLANAAYFGYEGGSSSPAGGGPPQKAGPSITSLLAWLTAGLTLAWGAWRVLRDAGR